MSDNNHVYTLQPTKQLIDLNGSSTNFELDFKVVSEGYVPFYGIVVDQTTLDNSSNLEYQFAQNGEFGGSITQDNGIYQNYFLVLRADTPCKATVQINKREIPKRETYIPQSPTKSQSKSRGWGIYIFIGLLVIAGVGFYIWNKNKKPKVEEPNYDLHKSNIFNPSPMLPSPKTPPRLMSPQMEVNPLVNKLNELDF